MCLQSQEFKVFWYPDKLHNASVKLSQYIHILDTKMYYPVHISLSIYRNNHILGCKQSFGVLCPHTTAVLSELFLYLA